MDLAKEFQIRPGNGPVSETLLSSGSTTSVADPDVYSGSRIRIFPPRIQGEKESGSRIRIRNREFTVSNFSPKKLFLSSPLATGHKSFSTW
jgi:hypothetical protein